MDFSPSQYTQLFVALVLAGILFVVSYIAPPRWIVVFIILMSPFQPINSGYGSINMVITYLVGLAFLLRGRLTSWPMIWPVMLILFAYLLSLSQTLAATYLDHILYLISIGADFVTFYIVYNYFLKEQDPRFAFRVFTGVAALVAVYCALAMMIGFEHIAVFGIQELTFGSNLEAKQRLNGPFDAPGTNGEFLALQIIMLVYLVTREGSRVGKWVLAGLMLASFGFLVATGSRGGFVALIIGLVLFAAAFRKELGAMMILKGGLVAIAFSGAALLVISFTQFNVLFERLESTKVYGLVPDSREGIFQSAFEKSLQEPLLGHGPRIHLLHEEDRRIPGYEPLGYYPHNLYLFLFYTLGGVGLMAYLVFFGTLLVKWWRASSRPSDDPLLKGSPRLAIVLMLTFLASQYRIEFLRELLTDYQQYLFALWAMFLAFSSKLQQRRISERNYVSEKTRSMLSAKQPLTSIGRDDAAAG